MASHSKTLDGTQTLKVSWLLKREDQVAGGIALEKGGDPISSKQEEHHPFFCLFVSYLGKPFDDGMQQQPVCVLVEHHEYIINDLDGTGHRNRKNCVCGNGCCFFGCLVCEIITWNERMARDPLNKDGRRDGVDGTVN